MFSFYLCIYYIEGNILNHANSHTKPVYRIQVITETSFNLSFIMYVTHTSMHVGDIQMAEMYYPV